MAWLFAAVQIMLIGWRRFISLCCSNKSANFLLMIVRVDPESINPRVLVMPRLTCTYGNWHSLELIGLTELHLFRNRFIYEIGFLL